MTARAHLLVALISVASVLFILRLVRRRQLRAKYSFLWLSIGVGLVILAVSPALLDRAAKWVGISYPPAVIFLLAIALLLFVVVHFSWELSRLEERTRTLAEQLALVQIELGGETSVSAEDTGSRSS